MPRPERRRLRSAVTAASVLAASMCVAGAPAAGAQESPRIDRVPDGHGGFKRVPKGGPDHGSSRARATRSARAGAPRAATRSP